MKKRYGFTRTGMTSWVGSSVTGYLAAEQVARLSEDNLVRLISDVEPSEFSAPPPYYDFNPGNATFSWGAMAVTSHSKLSGSARRVYVIDGGVAQHTNLPSVLARKNTACGADWPGNATSGDCEYTTVSYANFPGVGCYGHATHVAGIIAGAGVLGATYGVYVGVDVISVNVTMANLDYRYGTGSPQTGGPSPSIGWCADVAPSSDAIGFALDYVYWDSAYNGGGKVSIANISINSGQMGWKYYSPDGGTWVAEDNYGKVRTLATPGAFQTSSGDWATYPGVFVSQSAGNDSADACGGVVSRAYHPAVGYIPGGAPPNWYADPYDGIMVVGAINSAGQPVTSYAAPYPGTVGPSSFGSNYGPCVDVWAPGDSIVSAWGDHAFWLRNTTMQPDTRVGTTYSGIVGSGNSGWMYLSGTSMAAPHVAGVAAYLADAHGLTSPAAIEQKIRSLSQQYNGAVDAAGYPVRTLQSQ